MIRMSFRMKIAMSVAVAATGLTVASLRLDRPARRRAERIQADPEAAAPPSPRTRSGVSKESSSTSKTSRLPAPLSTRGRRPIRRGEDGRRWHIHALVRIWGDVYQGVGRRYGWRGRGWACSHSTRRATSRRRTQCGS